MELRHLRHFVALVQEGSFTAAARREHIVQSGLSASIQALERDLGAELYVRGSRPVRLTPAGEAMLSAARGTLQEAERVRRRVAEATDLLAGPFRIGMGEIGPTDSSCPLVSWLADFTSRHPGLSVSVSQLGPASMLAQVEAGILDCAVVPDAVPGGRTLRRLPISAEPLVAIVPTDRMGDLGRAGGGRVPLADLVGLPFVETQAGWGSRDQVDAALTELGLHRTLSCEVRERSMVLELVRAGLGVALVPRGLALAGRQSAGLRYEVLDLTEQDTLVEQLDLCLPRGASASPGARRFEQMVEKQLANSG